MEKIRLRRVCHGMEYEAAERMKHLKANYGAMAFNTIFPNADAQMSIARLVGYAIKGVLKSTRFKSGLATAVIMIVEIIGARKLVGFFENLFSKKEEKKDPERKK